MNFNIYTFCKFHPVCILPFTKYKYLINNLFKLRTEIYSILINDGSLTKSIEYLTNDNVNLQKLQKYNCKLQLSKRKIRCVWIETSLYCQLTFARSLWITIYLQNTSKLTKELWNFPIGKYFIKNRSNISKVIHELYYGYNELIESTSIQKIPIWGRKYTLYYKNEYYITIQELFSYKIIKYLIK
uniref:Ycf21 n=1 Tax=Chondria tumulosa TaxID=2740715 RepID=A0A896SV31_9FLOR|nr:hypothetical protein K8K75_pgp152 [Chondria tumulosa]QSD57055.1 hypothetical protein [Chondria tumulosa]